jgi:hypothetical protein
MHYCNAIKIYALIQCYYMFRPHKALFRLSLLIVNEKAHLKHKSQAHQQNTRWPHCKKEKNMKRKNIKNETKVIEVNYI